jgi:SAM-dependent methyltransferase
MTAPATVAPAQRTTTAELGRLLRHRAVGAGLLHGEGLEIGALHYPLVVPGAASVSYLDVEDETRLRQLFPELADEALVTPDWLGDVGCASVPSLTGRRFDFIVMNHVLEHVANPIQVVANVWTGLVEGGLLALSVPDKAFTFDRARRLTSFEHLLSEYYRGVTSVDPSHYVDLLEDLRPDVFATRARFHAALTEAAERREHAHVWDSESFSAFWERSASLLTLDATIVYESTARSNRFEYFAVIRKAAPDRRDGDAWLRVLAALYRARIDLQHAMPASEPDLLRRLLTWATTAGASVDSDAPTLRAYQNCYRRLLNSGSDELSRLEACLRTSSLGDTEGHGMPCPSDRKP